MVCRKIKKGAKRCARRKKVIRKDGKRYYRAGKSGLVRLKGAKKAPRIRRGGGVVRNDAENNWFKKYETEAVLHQTIIL